MPMLTLGGLKVEEATGLVRREDGSVIPGLYAAGRTAVGICSNVYVSGLAYADCIFSGRRVGRSVAAAGAARTAGTQRLNHMRLLMNNAPSLNSLGLPPVAQIGFVVRDIEESMAKYGSLYGPWSPLDGSVPGGHLPRPHRRCDAQGRHRPQRPAGDRAHPVDRR